MKSLTTLGVSLAVLLSVAGSAHAQTLSPGKSVAYTFLTNVPVATSFGSIGQVSLLKGKSKRVLEVDVKLIDRALIADALGAYVTVNGVQMYPGAADAPQLTGCDHAWINCTLASHFWADLDVLEAANPGMFKNQPLTVDVQGIAHGTPTANGTVSIRARMVKK